MLVDWTEVLFVDSYWLSEIKMSAALLDEQQADTVRAFRDITQLDEEEAIRTLQHHMWNLENAVNAALIGDTSMNDNPPNEDAASTRYQDSVQERADASRSNEGDALEAGETPSTAPVLAPGPELLSYIDSIPGGFLVSSPLRFIGSGIRYALSPVWTNSEPVGDQVISEKFIRHFEEEYGEQHPAFVPCAYREAVGRAARESKILMVYLQSEDHQDTPSFCRNTLCTEQLVSLVTDCCIIWGGSVMEKDGYVLSEQLEVTRYPCVALLGCSSAGVSLLCRIEGNASVDALCAQLGGTVAQAQQRLQQTRAQQRAREETASLRQEQEREFQEALEADRRREREAAAAAAAAEEARATAEREQAAAAAEAAAVAAAAAAELSRKRGLVVEEPAVGTPGCSRLRMQLPGGERMERRFRGEHTIEDVRNFIDVTLSDHKMELASYELATNFPRRVYADPQVTLQDAGLVPQAMLYIQGLA